MLINFHNNFLQVCVCVCEVHDEKYIYNVYEFRKKKMQTLFVRWKNIESSLIN